MSNIVEKDWVTASGLRAIVLICVYQGRKTHRCGYVGVPAEHPLFGKDYSEQLDCIQQETVDNAKLGKKSPLLLFTAGVGSDKEGLVRRSLDIAIDVHGGLTYSNNSPDYPVESSLWWFGFDCAHAGDAEIEPDHRWIPRGGIVRSLDYCERECESLAAQLEELCP